MLPPLVLPRASSTSETAPDCVELESKWSPPFGYNVLLASQVASAVLPTCAAIEKPLLTCALVHRPLSRLKLTDRSLASQNQ